MRSLLLILAIASTALPAAVGLTTVPPRDTTRLTIYNSVDLTLVQESRRLVIKEGRNRIQFQWAGTLIDATSLELRPLAEKERLDVVNVIYPPGSEGTLIWEIDSEVAGEVPFEISYFTSGLSWSADYVLRTDADEATAALEGRISVINQSGADYHRARVRLVVGTINLVEKIRDLATGQLRERSRRLAADDLRRCKRAFVDTTAAVPGTVAAPEVVSARLADYHLFTVGGLQSVADRTTTRFRAIANSEPLAIESVYRVPSNRQHADKVLRFINDAAHHLPDGPLPDGDWHVFRVLDPGTARLSYLGRTHHAYVPPEQKVELVLGPDPAISVRQRHRWHRKTHYSVTGHIAYNAYDLRLTNTKPIPITVHFLIETGGGKWFVRGVEGERRSEQRYRVIRRLEPGATLAIDEYQLIHYRGSLVHRKEPPDPLGPHPLPNPTSANR